MGRPCQREAPGAELCAAPPTVSVGVLLSSSRPVKEAGQPTLLVWMPPAAFVALLFLRRETFLSVKSLTVFQIKSMERAKQGKITAISFHREVGVCTQGSCRCRVLS